MKDDMLRIPPERMQSDLMWHSKDKDISFDEFRDLVVTASARLLSIQRPPGRVQGLDNDNHDAPPPPPETDEAAMRAVLAGISNADGVIAAFQRHQRRGGPPTPPTRRDPSLHTARLGICQTGPHGSARFVVRYTATMSAYAQRPQLK